MGADGRIPMLDLGRLHAPLAEDLRRAFDEALETSRFIGGPEVERFEGELAALVGTRFAIGTSSGTDALIAALTALGAGPEDEVVTSAYSFFASAGAIARVGARPVFADIDPGSFCVDPAAVEAALTGRTVGIVAVHLFGQCADMDPILEAAGRRGLWVIEDAAQAIGARYRDRRAGSMGRAGALSFFPAKNLGALGDAGAVATDDLELAAQVRSLRVHGAAEKHLHEKLGWNFRLDAVQARFLSVKIGWLDRWEEGRRRAAARYRELLADIDGIAAPPELPGRRHVYNQYVIRVAGGRRDRMRAALDSAGVASAIHYPRPLHMQPCLDKLGGREGDFPEAERAARESLAIPMDPNLSPADQERVAAALRSAP